MAARVGVNSGMLEAWCEDRHGLRLGCVQSELVHRKTVTWLQGHMRNREEGLPIGVRETQ